MISIIGIGCIYPDASSPIELWNNVLSKRRAFRKIPKNRIDLSYYDDESSDSIYIKNACLIKDYQFDRKKFQISNSIFNSADLTHWLALDVAHRTLADSGFVDGYGLDKERTAVIVGNTLTGEFSRSELMRLRWPYVKRLLKSKLSTLDIDIENFIKDFEKSYKQPFNEPNEDSLSGGLSNTIAGRISNYFNFNGGCFTVDGACSSSLVAITQACNLLENDSIDYALVGGVDLSLDPFELIGFSRISAMSHGDMKVYDKNSDGFLPGEGCGFVLLTKTDNAISNGIKKYCDVIGWGISSDGSGGLTRPEINGQKLAIERACKKANILPNDITLFEGHGTGTKVGDNTELCALNQMLENSDKKHYISSIKTNIGHTKAAAGIAGLIKVIMSLQTQIIPPITSNNNPHDEIVKKDSKLCISKKSILWPNERPLIAGVSSFGFGGINSHVILQNPARHNQIKLNQSYSQKNKTYQDYELMILDSESKETLLNKIDSLIRKTENISLSELADISVHLIRQINYKSQYKLSIICNSPSDLINKLNKAKLQLINNNFIFDKSGIYYSETQNFETCFVFPGQAAPVRFNNGIFDTWNIDGLKVDFGEASNTSIAQPCIINSEYSSYTLLQKFNINPNYVIGHSLGELMSLYSVGIIDKDSLFDLTKNRGNIMQNFSKQGSMIVVFCDHSKIENIVNNYDDIDIAGYNSSNQVVLSGTSDQIESICKILKSQNLSFVTLPVTRMFHSRHMGLAATEWRKILSNRKFNKQNKMSCKYISSINGKIIYEENIVDLLVNQFTNPVLFTKALCNINKKNTFFIEVGPGNILDNLITSDGGLCISTDFGSDSIFGVLSAVGASFCMSDNKVDLSVLCDRFVKSIDIEASDVFFSNPCEIDTQTAKNTTNEEKKINIENTNNKDALSIIKKCISIKTELSIDSIKNTDNFLKDLHLNSISVGQIIAESCKLLDITVSIPLSEFSNKTIEESAEFLQSLLKDSENYLDQKSKNIEGVSNWVQSYSIVLEKEELITSNTKTDSGEWFVIYDENYEFKEQAENIAKKLHGTGVVVCLDSFLDIEFLLSSIQKIIKDKINNIIVIQHANFYTSFFRTLQQEANIKTLIINLPKKIYDTTLVINEFLNNKKQFNSIIYDNNYIRYVESFKINNPINSDNKKINETDVILVTGGSKGITHECAKKLALETGCSLAIIGRSDKDSVKNNLELLDKFNIKYSYYVADVCDKNQLILAIKNILRDYGTITGIIHGAGTNNPSLIDALTSEKFYQTYNPKVLGLKNLLETIDPKDLKIMVNFGSIIGRLGMIGQADYALSNAITSDMVTLFKQEHPNVNCLSLEWSVWSDVGMGANLGKIESLINKGIIPISVNDGVKQFVSLVNCKTESCIIPVIGRLGNICEFNNYKTKEIPFLRFLENIRVYYPGLELVSEFELSETNDLYLSDHEFKGEKIFPAVMMIEAVMQSYKALTGIKRIPRLNNIVFNQPIIINKVNTIRVCCLKNTDYIRVVIRSSDTNYKIDHFSCEITNLEDTRSFEFIKLPKDSNILTDYMYKNLLFQKNRFANIDHYYQLSAYESYASIKSQSNDIYFNRSFPQNMIVGDPGVRDSCLHSLQCCVPDKMLLPAKIESIEIFNVNYSKDKIAHAYKVWEKEDEYCYNLIICDTNGKVLEIWNNILLRVLEPINYTNWNKDLLGCHIKRCLFEKCDATIFFNDINDGDDIVHRADGKPEHKDYYISKSYCDNLVLVTNSKYHIGCDIQCVKPYQEKLLNTIANNLFDTIKQIYPEQEDILQTRVWTIFESIKKSGLNLNEPITLDNITDNFIKLKIAEYKIYSFLKKIDQTNYCITLLVYEQ